MKVFVVGLPKSGKTTIAQAIANSLGYFYVGASWLHQSFRSQNAEEHIDQYIEDRNQYLVGRLKDNPNLYINNFNAITNQYKSDTNFIIDGISSPRDFVHLFDYNKDVVVFLNRTDNESSFKEFENVSISVIKDYCYWMSASGLLAKDNWLEYNFKIPGVDADMAMKALGNKNTVFIAKSINNVIKHLLEVLKNKG